MNKFLLVTILLILIQCLLETFLPAYSCLGGGYADYSLGFAAILALIMMVRMGPFMSTRYFSFAKLGMGVVVLGVCFKILHLTGADQLMTLGFLLTLVAYGIYFILKRPKAILDYFKFLTMLCFLISTVLGMLSVMSESTTDVIDLVGLGLFWTTFLLFVFIERKRL